MREELGPRKRTENQLFSITSSVAITLLYSVCVVVSCFEFIRCKDNKMGKKPSYIQCDFLIETLEITD